MTEVKAIYPLIVGFWLSFIHNVSNFTNIFLGNIKWQIQPKLSFATEFAFWRVKLEM